MKCIYIYKLKPVANGGRKIISESVDRKDQSILEISSNGDSIVTVYDDQECAYEEYELDICDMSYDDVDIKVLDNSFLSLETLLSEK